MNKHKRYNVGILIGGVHTYFPKEHISGIATAAKELDINVCFFLGTQTQDFFEDMLGGTHKDSFDYQFNIFLIHVLGKTLAYKVDQIKTVLPEESSELDIIEGEDHVTLVTCTPYGVNTHRLLIRGIRTEYVEPEEKAEETPIQQIAKVDPVKIMIIGLVAMVIMIIIVYIVIRRKSRKTEESSRKDE